MAIVWKDRNDWFKSNATNGWDSFQEHNEGMRLFRKSHAPRLEGNAPKQDKLVLPGNMRNLYISRTMSETGGTRGPNVATAWLALMLMWKLAPHKFSQN